MSTRIENRLERLYNILERLKQKSLKGTPIIVEGKNDVQTLNVLGISGNIILAKTSGKSFIDVLDEIEKKDFREVVLLFDFDRRGREWTNRLSYCLERVKIIPNLVFWKMLLGLVGRDLNEIEGLATYIDTLKNKQLCRKL